MKKLTLLIIILAVLAFAVGYLMRSERQPWAAFPEQIIVDSPEERQRINTD
jgi:hypothetical protein